MAEWQQEADKLTEERKVMEALAHLQKVEVELGEAGEKDAALQWRLSRAYWEASESDKEQAQAFADKALAHAEKAYELAPDSSSTNKWLSIAIARQGDFQDTKSKIQQSFRIKEHADKAAELAPEDSSVAHLQGRWCFGVASIGFLERKVAAVLFDTPPESTYEEALEHFLRHEEILKGNGSIRNKLFIGQTYEALKQTDKAKEYYKLAMEKKADTPKEVELVAEAKKKLESLNSSWW